MEYTSKLRSLVESGVLLLVNIVAVPRSMSTVLGRLLSQSADVAYFINEPFNRNNSNVEIAAREIFLNLGSQIAVSGGRKVVIIKNMATYLSDEAFEFFDSNSMATIFVVRDPLVQIASLTTRMANDLALETGADIILQEDIEPYLPAVDLQLRGSSLSRNYSRTGWGAINRHFNNRRFDHPTIIVDGSDLVNNTGETVRGICNKLGILFSNSMLRGWNEGFININTKSSSFATKENAWTRDAATSDRILKKVRKPINVDLLSQSLRDHITMTAVPVYDALSAEKIQ